MIVNLEKSLMARYSSLVLSPKEKCFGVLFARGEDTLKSLIMKL
jgi:hypothetical protein